MNTEDEKVTNFEEEKNKDRKRRNLLIILVLLMLMFSVLSYFLGYILGKIDIVATSGRPGHSQDETNNITNNIDNNINNKPVYVINNTQNANNSNKGDNNINNSNKNNGEIDKIEITDEDMKWNVQNKLDIFSNPQYHYTSVVAPNSEYYYQFMVENLTDKPIRYDIVFTEANPYSINLKYKLKLDNSYLLGNEDVWIDASNLNLNNVVLANNSKNLYILEWKWVESTEEKDTAAAGKGYEMFINIYADEF